jgi:hypothetical protein
MVPSGDAFEISNSRDQDESQLPFHFQLVPSVLLGLPQEEGKSSFPVELTSKLVRRESFPGVAESTVGAYNVPPRWPERMRTARGD